MILNYLFKNSQKLTKNKLTNIQSIELIEDDLKNWKITVLPTTGFHKDIVYYVDIIFEILGKNITRIKIYPYGELYDKLITPMLSKRTSNGLCIRELTKKNKNTYGISRFYNKRCSEDICNLITTIIYHLNNIEYLIEKKETISGIRKNWNELI
jgi:hypothetical protein